MTDITANPAAVEYWVRLKVRALAVGELVRLINTFGDSESRCRSKYKIRKIYSKND